MEKHLKRAIAVTALIKRKSTGTPAELAKRLNVSASLVKKDISTLREVLGAPIVFDRTRRSYIYKDNGIVKILFEREQDDLPKA